MEGLGARRTLEARNRRKSSILTVEIRASKFRPRSVTSLASTHVGNPVGNPDAQATPDEPEFKGNASMSDTKNRDNRAPQEETGQLTSTYPVVGIGASAGGIRALQTFFDGMPSDCGMAFVV